MFFVRLNDDRMAVHNGGHGHSGGDIQKYLQYIFKVMRTDDTLKMAVKLESVHHTRIRYLVVVTGHSNLDHEQQQLHKEQEECCLLGIDCHPQNMDATIGLVLPLFRDTEIQLDGDGGYRVKTTNRTHIFKPVSVQAMWSSLQTLHSVVQVARNCNYFIGGNTHRWCEEYNTRIQSSRSCLNEWNAMDDLISKRPPSPDLRNMPKEQAETEELIKCKLKEIMTSVDLDEVTSKFIRTRVEKELDMNLTEYKSFIDREMLTILGQMGTATQIFEYLYLGSEWNASNLEELKLKGVGKILNVTREVDNFYPGAFDYFNVRVYDDDSTEMIRHWDKTYRYIYKSMEEGQKVLVHCKMGISRSASVVIAYVMKSKNWSLNRALQFVKNKRNCIRPNENFLKQLEVYQGILSASKQRHNKLWRSRSETNLNSSCSSASNSPVQRLLIEQQHQQSGGDTGDQTVVDNVSRKLHFMSKDLDNLVQSAQTQSSLNLSNASSSSDWRRKSWSPDDSYNINLEA